MSTAKIIYTHTDEAPALATYSLLPIVKAFTQRRRHRGRDARHLSSRTYPRQFSGQPDGRSATAGRPRRARRTRQDRGREHHQAAQHQRVDPAAEGCDQGTAAAGLWRAGLPRGSAERCREAGQGQVRESAGQRRQSGVARRQFRSSRRPVGEAVRKEASALDGCMEQGLQDARCEHVWQRLLRQ